jgi:hypothetical protein
MTQDHLRQRQHLHLVLQRHPRPTPVLLHQTQGTVDTPLSQSAQRARKPPNHEYCQTAFVPVAHSRRSRPARQTELTRSREVEAALGLPPLVCHRPVPLLRSSAANGRRTKRRKLRPHQIQPLRLRAASQSPRNAERQQLCSGLTVSRSSSRTLWLLNGCAIHRTPRRGTVSRTSRHISAPTSKKRSSRR